MRKRIKMERCPNCDREHKLVSRCDDCGRLCCNECSVEYRCINCYVRLTTKVNVKDYFTDKYKAKPIGFGCVNSTT